MVKESIPRMAQLGEAIARYHQLLEDVSFRDLAWAEELQEQMRQQGLTDSGRLLAPILRPDFITKSQLTRLTTVSERLATILDQVEALALQSPQLLNRVQMLPAEKMLASLSCGYARSSIASRMDAGQRNGSLSLHGLETCKPVGLGYADRLADLFLRLPIMKEFQKSAYQVSKVGGPRPLLRAILHAWKEFGGNYQPNIAIVELRNPAGTTIGEGELVAELLKHAGASVRLVWPEQLEYSDGKLRSGDFQIDVVFRRLLTRELLVRFDLSHPLLRAYRDHAVCVVNGFRSEMTRRRALFELLTDEAVMEKFAAADRKLVEAHVPWTRVIFARRTQYKDQEIDLFPFIVRNRAQLALRPNDDSAGHQIFVGADLSQNAWERSLRLASQTSYVVQEHLSSCPQAFPVLQYGAVQMIQTNVSVHPHIFDGKLQGASAALETSSEGFSKPLALTPVLLLEEK